jgi:hypothetical protein
MLKLTSFRLQLLWGLLVGTIVLLSTIRLWVNQISILGAYFNRDWVHFLAYVTVSILPLLAWRRKTGLALSLGMVVPATGVEIIRAVMAVRSPDVHYMVINTLGIAAGILLGLNILRLGSRMSHVDI